MITRPLFSVLSLATLMLLSACTQQPAAQLLADAASAASPIKPYATLQELMEYVVDASADGIWESSGFVSDAKGVRDLSPTNDKQWLALRGKVITLIEAANLVMVEGRQVSRAGFSHIEPGNLLSSKEVEEAIAKDRTTFVGFAQALQQVGIQTLKPSTSVMRTPFQLSAPRWTRSARAVTSASGTRPSSHLIEVQFYDGCLLVCLRPYTKPIQRPHATTPIQKIRERPPASFAANGTLVELPHSSTRR